MIFKKKYWTTGPNQLVVFQEFTMIIIILENNNTSNFSILEVHNHPLVNVHIDNLLVFF